MLTVTEALCLLYRWLCTGGKGVRQTTLAAVLTIVVESHEDASAALGRRALTTEAFDLSVRLNLVVLQDRHLDLLTLVLDLLGSLIGSLVSDHSVTRDNKN